MAKIVKYTVTFLGTIEVDNNASPDKIEHLIGVDMLETGGDIRFANDIEYDIEEED